MGFLQFNTQLYVFGYGIRDPQFEIVRIEIMRTDRMVRPKHSLVSKVRAGFAWGLLQSQRPSWGGQTGIFRRHQRGRSMNSSQVISVLDFYVFG